MRRVTGAILFFLLTATYSYSLAQHQSDSAFLSKEFIRTYDLYLTYPDSAIAVASRNLQACIDGRLKYLEGSYYFLLSKAHWAKGNYSLSTEYGFKSLRIVKDTDHVSEWGESLLALGRTFCDLKNFSQGSEFITDAVNLALTNNNKTLLADAYREKTFLLLELQQYDSTLYYSDKGIAIYEQLHDTLDISILYGRKARVYFYNKDFRSSTLFTRKSIRYDILTNNRRALGISYLQAAQNAHGVNKPDSAIYFLRKSIPLNRSFANIPPLIRSYNLLAEIYLSRNQPMLAIEQLKIVSQLKDSLYNLQKTGQVQGMRSLYDLESKENTIKLLEQENALHEEEAKNQQLIEIFLTTGIFLLMLLLFFFWRWRTVQTRANVALSEQNKAIELQKEKIEIQAKNLEELNQLKSKLFSVIGHDLRGPLANLHALLELLTNNLVTADEFLTLSEKLKSHLSVTQRTLENLLNWSLSQMDGIKTQKAKIDVSASIEDAARLLSALAQSKKISIDITEVQSLSILADPNQIHLVLRNLIHNAIKFSKEGGRVILSAKAKDTFCMITVADFGIGMSAHEVESITTSSDHFTKIGTQHEKGTGLGLLLCREFINRMNGSFYIQSESGNGTLVSFTVPLG